MPNQQNLPQGPETHQSPYAQQQQQMQHKTLGPGQMGMTSPPSQQNYQQGHQGSQQPNQQSFGQAMGQNQGSAQQEPPSRVMPNIGQPVQDNQHGDEVPSRVMPRMGTGPQPTSHPAFLAQAIPVVLQPVGAPMAVQQAPPMQAHNNNRDTRTPGSVPPTALGMSTTGPIIPSGPPPHPAHEADSYLDRAEHDPKLRQMLQGAQSKTVHTSQYQPSEHPMTAQSFNKPLPTPGQNQNQGLQRAATVAPGGMHGNGNGAGRASRAGTMMSHNNGGSKNRRNSLMSNLHAHSHTQSNLNGGDRYPAFPHQNMRGHSRQSSWNGNGNAVDPANIELPK
jgi:hypothetical protein